MPWCKDSGLEAILSETFISPNSWRWFLVCNKWCDRVGWGSVIENIIQATFNNIAPKVYVETIALKFFRPESLPAFFTVILSNRRSYNFYSCGIFDTHSMIIPMEPTAKRSLYKLRPHKDWVLQTCSKNTFWFIKINIKFVMKKTSNMPLEISW